MPQPERFIQELKPGALVDHVRGKNIFADAGLAGGRDVVVITGKSKLQTVKTFRPDKETEIERLAVIVVRYVLDRVGTGACAPAVADFSDVVKAQPAGNRSGCADPHIVNGKDSSLVFKLKKERTSDGRLHQGAVMIGCVVVANSGVISAKSQVDPLVDAVDQFQTFRLDGKFISLRIGFNYRFCEKTDFVGQPGGNKEVKLTQGKGVGAAFLVAGAPAYVAIPAKLQPGCVAQVIKMR